MKKEKSRSQHVIFFIFLKEKVKANCAEKKFWSDDGLELSKTAERHQPTKPKGSENPDKMKFIFFYILFYFLFMTDKQRKRQRHRWREKHAPCREPDMGLDPRSTGSSPGPKAVLNHWATEAAQTRWNFKKHIIPGLLIVKLLNIKDKTS